MEQLRHTWINSGSYRIFTRIGKPALCTGNELPVVLVHGLGVSGRYMQRLARRLARHWPVYVPDLPGFGKSSKPAHTLTVNELTDELAYWMNAAGLPRAVLIGNSFGCQLIANLCMRHPGKATACILQGPSVDRHACSRTRQVLRFLYDALYEDPAIIPIVLRDFIDCGFVRLWNTFNYMLQDKIEDKLPYIKVPSLIISGTHDPVTPPYWATELAQHLPQNKLIIFKNAPHAAHYSNPDKMYTAIVRFINQNINVHEITYS